MHLFNVPGWSVPNAPVSAPPKKRKRSFSHSNDSLGTVGLDKLFNKLSGSISQVANEGSSQQPNNAKVKPQKKKQKQKVKVDTKFTISHPKPLKPRRRTETSSSIRPRKRRKPSHTGEPTDEPTVEHATESGISHLTAMQKNMKSSLEAARFRFINETLYKSHSKDAWKLMQDPNVFDEYHVGFRRQVESWPFNPVDEYILQLSTYPTRTVIADLGCGDAALAKSLIPAGMTVLSFDLVSHNSYVIEADICDKIPLPGSENAVQDGPDVGEGHVVDVVVCALSLMGTNWPNCIREVWRVLKPDGELKIAEVASRFADVDKFLDLVKSYGFELHLKDESNSHFTLFEFRKVARKSGLDKKCKEILAQSALLHSCEYKRR